MSEVTTEELHDIIKLCTGGPPGLVLKMKQLAQAELSRRAAVPEPAWLVATKLQMLLDDFGPVHNDPSASHIVSLAIAAIAAPSQPSAADKPVAASEIELLQSELAATKKELAKERVNQASFNECAAELAEARAQLAAIKGKAPEPQKAD